ncbi:hypothetical protein FAF44_25040, partial [Nonomuraea sp. MG754425]|nr:hypothetical protein [Nonomuraea sp. MG754425]
MVHGRITRAMRQAAWGAAETMASAEVEEPAPVFGEAPARMTAAGVDPVDVRSGPRAHEAGTRTLRAARFPRQSGDQRGRG